MGNKIKEAHYLVHIGFDPREAPRFTSAIKAYIDYIAKRTNCILVFVNVPALTHEDLVNKNRMSLFSLLSGLVKVNKSGLELYTDSMTLEGVRGDMQLNEFERLRLFIEDRVLNNSSATLIDLYDDLADTYSNENIFGVNCGRSGEGIILPTNQSRFWSINSYARQKMGEYRIFEAYMPPEDAQMLVFALRDALNIQRMFYVPDNDLHRLYERVMMENVNHLETIGDRDRIAFFSNIKAGGFSFDQKTLHYIGGEHLGNCVVNFAILLMYFYGFYEGNVEIRKEISIEA